MTFHRRLYEGLLRLKEKQKAVLRLVFCYSYNDLDPNTLYFKIS